MKEELVCTIFVEPPTRLADLPQPRAHKTINPTLPSPIALNNYHSDFLGGSNKPISVDIVLLFNMQCMQDLAHVEAPSQTRALDGNSQGSIAATRRMLLYTNSYNRSHCEPWLLSSAIPKRPNYVNYSGGTNMRPIKTTPTLPRKEVKITSTWNLQ